MSAAVPPPFFDVSLLQKIRGLAEALGYDIAGVTFSFIDADSRVPLASPGFIITFYRRATGEQVFLGFENPAPEADEEGEWTEERVAEYFGVRLARADRSRAAALN